MTTSHRIKDWALLAALVAMWGSAFLFIKLGVATVPPATLAASRLALGAATLYAVMRWRGLALPPAGSRWLSFGALAIVGNCIPFYLIGWGQQVIDSALAGILMAIMPLATLLLAHFLLAHFFVAGERMTANRALGFSLGFVGIVVLMGPAALAGLGGSLLAVTAQAAVLAGALCYAANSVMARRLIETDILVASTAVLIVATIAIVPVALILDRPWTLAPSMGSAVAIVWLGVGPTALATLLYFTLIASAGPTFMSLVNYLSPMVALLAGVTLLGEHPGASAIAGLGLILLGIALSRRH
ncbi:MAG: EamA family transporter [Betaproteobacteria bacterium]|nr:EamA family transporter [Betaproteobacteria bacterium]